MDQLIVMMAAMAKGDLSKRMSGTYEGELLRLKTDANATADKLAQVVGQTVDGISQHQGSATAIASWRTDLSSRTEEQVASLEEMAAGNPSAVLYGEAEAENAGQATQLAAARARGRRRRRIVRGRMAMGEIEPVLRQIARSSA